MNLVVGNAVGDGQAVAFTTEVIYSPSQPTGDNFGKLWVKTTGNGPSNPRGVGILIDGEYVIIPIPEDAEPPPQQVPTGGIILFPNSSTPEGWASISSTGLPTLPGGSNYQYISKLGS